MWKTRKVGTRYKPSMVTMWALPLIINFPAFRAVTSTFHTQSLEVPTPYRKRRVFHLLHNLLAGATFTSSSAGNNILFCGKRRPFWIISCRWLCNPRITCKGALFTLLNFSVATRGLTTICSSLWILVAVDMATTTTTTKFQKLVDGLTESFVVSGWFLLPVQFFPCFSNAKIIIGWLFFLPICCILALGLFFFANIHGSTGNCRQFLSDGYHLFSVRVLSSIDVTTTATATTRTTSKSIYCQCRLSGMFYCCHFSGHVGLGSCQKAQARAFAVTDASTIVNG